MPFSFYLFISNYVFFFFFSIRCIFIVNFQCQSNKPLIRSKKKALNPTHTNAPSSPPTPWCYTEARYKFWPQGTRGGPQRSRWLNTSSSLPSCLNNYTPAFLTERVKPIQKGVWHPPSDSSDAVKKQPSCFNTSVFQSIQQMMCVFISIRAKPGFKREKKGKKKTKKRGHTVHGHSMVLSEALFFLSSLLHACFATNSSVANKSHSTSYSTIRASVAALILV